MVKCNEPGSHQGDCCCNCVYQCEITKHPWNEEELLKGRISEHVSYGCASFFAQHSIMGFEGVQKETSIGKVIAMDRKHGMCEEHTARK